MTSTGPGDPRMSFGAAAAEYDRIRPRYPKAVFDTLFALLPEPPEVVEVGPGTGQATRDLLAGGAAVHAVEINPAMAAALRENLPTDRLAISIGDFEELDLGERSADAVFSATAYHWIAPAAQLDRPAELLRPCGILAVVDLIQVASPADRGFFAAAQPIYTRYGQGHTGPPAPLRADVDPPIRGALVADNRFGDVVTHRYDWDQNYSAADYRTLMTSYSTTQMMAEADRAGLLADMETFIDAEFDGQVTRPLVVALTTARRMLR